jgi:hypothetical protein
MVAKTNMKIPIYLALLLACVLAGEPAKAQRSDWRMSFIPPDPWRVINGQTNYVKLNGVQFCGKIMDVTPHGVLMEGDWGPLGTLYFPATGLGDTLTQTKFPDYFVTNFPYATFAGQVVPSAERLMAWYAGNCTFKTANGKLQIIRELDYGAPCGPNPVLLAAAQKQIQEAEIRRREIALKKMELLEQAATNGDSSAQYSLGFHYLHGLGCQTNEVMGLFWLMKAAQQGNLSASNDLQEIEWESTNGFGALKR